MHALMLAVCTFLHPSYACPSTCYCDQLTACGKPYLKPTPPVAGTAITAQSCSSANSETQGWVLQADGTLALASNMSLCITVPGPEIYPLVLGPCSASNAFTRSNTSLMWTHTATGMCLDLMASNGEIGVWACGTSQPNQAWA
jgi:hypothetical protein